MYAQPALEIRTSVEQLIQEGMFDQADRLIAEEAHTGGLRQQLFDLVLRARRAFPFQNYVLAVWLPGHEVDALRPAGWRSGGID